MLIIGSIWVSNTLESCNRDGRGRGLSCIDSSDSPGCRCCARFNWIQSSKDSSKEEKEDKIESIPEKRAVYDRSGDDNGAL